MTLRDFLDNYDIKEGDLLECENGEVYIILRCGAIGWMFTGPQPHQNKRQNTAKGGLQI